MTTAMKPTIHLNGTSKGALLEGYCSAADAVRTAITSINEDASPNGRDYYPQGPDAIRVATAEHVRRLDMLQEILTDLEALAQHVADWGGR